MWKSNVQIPTTLVVEATGNKNQKDENDENSGFNEENNVQNGPSDGGTISDVADATVGVANNILSSLGFGGQVTSTTPTEEVSGDNGDKRDELDNAQSNTSLLPGDGSLLELIPQNINVQETNGPAQEQISTLTDLIPENANGESN